MKSKHAVPTSAADLYTSELFRRRRAYAEARALPWFILSAEHGLLRPETVVAPYDRALADQPTGYRTAWGSWVAVKLDQELGDLTWQRLEVHAGSAYVDALREPLRQRSCALDGPLHGLRLGEQLKWYDEYGTGGTDASDVRKRLGPRRHSQMSKRGAMAKYGRDDLEWDQLADAGLEILIECARSGGTTDYTSLSEAVSERTGLRRFDFDRPDERAAIGQLLGLIVERSFGTSGFMLSALVLYAGGSDAGSGFYALAADMGLLTRNASRKVKEEFWTKQVNGLYRYYAHEGLA